MLGVSVLLSSVTPELGEVKGMPWAQMSDSALISTARAGHTLAGRMCETNSQWTYDRTCVLDDAN